MPKKGVGGKKSVYSEDADAIGSNLSLGNTDRPPKSALGT